MSDVNNRRRGNMPPPFIRDNTIYSEAESDKELVRSGCLTLLSAGFILLILLAVIALIIYGVWILVSSIVSFFHAF